ncbi:MAG: tryptophan--tRNA ligase [Burkholderiales bacterium]|nr:MAG: tryptophan--tRNA ligase [Betaproteobacteria bacterium]TAG28721.1 MAG: tryptophan--tRNA ligase [Burkholderiales bacterium]TAG50182.1 MAG: tryptophan--tRNA ligase [Betaproteobacteria bacterium]
MNKDRVLSGMRATGFMHLGHYHGALKNWIKLQSELECFYFVADWHGLTSHYEDPRIIASSTFDMVTDWLAAGLDPNQATIFMQSQVPQHAELTLLLGMITPLGWLERVPTFKEQQENIKDKDLSTYGFLGYPLMQTADIVVYRANKVPVGADQVSHLEISREIARRFNHIYGREAGFEEKAVATLKKLGGKSAKEYESLKAAFGQDGNVESLDKARALIAAAGSISGAEKEMLQAFLTGARKVILPEPDALLTPTSKLVGLDGRKMSKSYGNGIDLREPPASVEQKIKRMTTDPKRARRTDPGNPDDCPVWTLHEVYSDAARKAWVREGCTTAGIGCLECKQPIIEAVNAELAPMQVRIKEIEAKPNYVKEVLGDGCAKARIAAEETMREVRDAMGLAKL